MISYPHSVVGDPYWTDTMLRARQELQRFSAVILCVAIALLIVIALFPAIR
jgi:hypothetical protein